MSQAELQRLFGCYNRRYWRSRLGCYTILVTVKHAGGFCDTRHRTIYINPCTPAKEKDAARVLPHEMAHAAANSGHGKIWQREMRRLIRLGAPLKKELSEYLSPFRIDANAILGEFEDAGSEADRIFDWRQARLSIGYKNGLVDKQGHATSRYSSRVLQKARRAWLKGRRQRVSKIKLRSGMIRML